MYNLLTYSGVKGKSEQLRLGRVTVICGPNESGKSAAANSLQLAVTGKCDIGARAVDQEKLLESGVAKVIANGRNIEASWELRGGKKKWDDPKTQGNMPVTVDEFWSLTGAERLRLVAPQSSLDSIESNIESLEKERKRLKAVIEAAPPPTPEEYTGPSLQSLQESLKEIDAKLAMHQVAKKAAEKADSIKALKLRNQSLLAPELEKLEAAKQELIALTERYHSICDQFRVYGEKTAAEPRIVKSARERGVSLRDAIRDTLSLVGEALHWSGVQPDAIDKHLLELESLAPQESMPEIPERWAGGVTIQVAMQESEKSMKQAADAVARLEQSIASIRHAIDQQEPDEVQGQLSVEEYGSLLMKRDALERQVAQANAWAAYEASIASQVKSKAESLEILQGVCDKLDEAKAELTREVQKLKGPVETLANKMLREAKQPELAIEVNQSGRGWSLDVSMGGVALEAMARSKRLLYGLCLLSAIQELSSAAGPVLIAECAEMDRNTLDMAVKALSIRNKGNVLLEHWCKPSEYDDVIDLSSGSLA